MTSNETELDFANPCELVRTTCQQWLGDNASTSVVDIVEEKIHDLADEILMEKQRQVQSKKRKESCTESNDALDVDNKAPSKPSTDEWIEWDEEEWHYTGKGFHGPETARKERVALFLLALDAINFCFWPPYDRVDNDNDDDDDDDDDDNKSDDNNDNRGKTGTSITNPLEYEHLAQALKRIAEMDHTEDEHETITNKNSSVPSKGVMSFQLSPQNLADVSESKFRGLLQPHFELLNTTATTNNSTTNNNDTLGSNQHPKTFHLPDISLRSALLREVGTVLMERYDGSATKFIDSAKGDASKLVELVATSFPGFRDEVVLADTNMISKSMDDTPNTNHNDNSDNIQQPSSQLRRIVFLKRAQILVGDWNAALQLHLNGMDRLTTFADYRVPQILRHKDILVYHSSLANQVDNFVQLKPSSVQEISIRASTVIAVQKLVQILNEKSKTSIVNGDNSSNKSNSINDNNDNDDEVSTPFTDVTVDWYLWQVGEKLNNEGRMKPFHRVRTQFY